jgi:predicted Zn-dependent protease
MGAFCRFTTQAGFLLLTLAEALSACGSPQSMGGGSPAGPSTAAENAVLDYREELGRPMPNVPPSSVLGALEKQLNSSLRDFAALADRAPYFIGYQVTDHKEVAVTATLGAVSSSWEAQKRTLDVDVRVGSHEFDNTHPLQGEPFGSTIADRQSWNLPVDEEPTMLAPTLWIATDRSYRAAVESYVKVKGNRTLKAGAEDESPDFSQEKPVVHYEPLQRLEVDRPVWEEKLRHFSAIFREHPEVLESWVTLRAEVVHRYLANSEGTRAQVSQTYFSLSFMGSTRTDDGMDLFRHDAIHVGSLTEFPSDDAIKARVQKVVDDLLALRRAPPAQPYLGPAILDGGAAGVFFHEVFGHRVEGHRQKVEEEGMTFAKQVGVQVMPTFIDVYDDPNIRRLNGEPLRGYYQVDDEGVRAQRSGLVQNGVLKGFLLSRAPTRGFLHSNGHGRREEGQMVVARQGNLVVHPSRTTTPAELKRLLIEEIKRQGKPYGLRFAEVAGGFTQTTRFATQSFRVTPIMLYRVYPDGREELVRGATIDGTPLTALSQILAAANDLKVFNGTCGAESGWVPVSASSPSLLVARVEIANSPTMKDKPPLLPPPPSDRGKP